MSGPLLRICQHCGEALSVESSEPHFCDRVCKMRGDLAAAREAIAKRLMADRRKIAEYMGVRVVEPITDADVDAAIEEARG